MLYFLSLSPYSVTLAWSSRVPDKALCGEVKRKDQNFGEPARSREVPQNQQAPGHIPKWDLVSSGFSISPLVSCLWQKLGAGRHTEGLRWIPGKMRPVSLSLLSPDKKDCCGGPWPTGFFSLYRGWWKNDSVWSPLFWIEQRSLAVWNLEGDWTAFAWVTQREGGNNSSVNKPGSRPPRAPVGHLPSFFQETP